MRKIITFLSLFISLGVLAGCESKDNKPILPARTYEEFFIESLLLCKDNIDHINLIPSIAAQKGWIEIADDKNARSFRPNARVFERMFLDQRYTLFTNDHDAAFVCTVRVENNLNVGVYTHKQIIEAFPPEDKDATILWKRFSNYKNAGVILSKKNRTTLDLMARVDYVMPGIDTQFIMQKHKPGHDVISMLEQGNRIKDKHRKDKKL